MGGLHGAWVYGIRVLRFLCYELYLSQPRLMTGEPGIPSHEELLQEIIIQKQMAIAELEANIFVTKRNPARRFIPDRVLRKAMTGQSPRGTLG